MSFVITNTQKYNNGMKFETEVFSLLRQNHIPFSKKIRYKVQLRKGTISVEPDISVQTQRDKLWLFSIKISLRERWKQDIIYDRIPNVDKIFLITKEKLKSTNSAYKFYDNIFILPRDQNKLLAVVTCKKNTGLMNWINKTEPKKIQ